MRINTSSFEGENRVFVFGSDTINGPFEQLTEKPVRIGRKSVDGLQTVYVDHGVELGAERFYYLARQDNSGKMTKVTGVVAGMAVIPAVEKGGAAD